MSLHRCSAVSRLVHLSLRSAAVRGGRSVEGEKEVAGGARWDEGGSEEAEGGREMGECVMRRETIKDLGVCGGRQPVKVTKSHLSEACPELKEHR